MSDSCESEVDDILENVGWNDSDYSTSGSEWLPSDEERERRNEKRKKSRASEGPGPSIEADSDEDEPIPKRKKKRTRTQKTKNSDDDTDDEPLTVLQEKLRDADSSDDEPLSSVQEKLHKEKERASTTTEPAVTDWVDGDLPETDILFTGCVEYGPFLEQTPYDYFTELIKDNMIEDIEKFTNGYALSKSGIELKTTRKEIELFIGLYLRMGLMKGHSVRAYWEGDTRYPPVADVLTKNRFELLARHIHFVDNEDKDMTEDEKKRTEFGKLDHG